MRKLPGLTVVVPAFNEQATVGSVILRLLDVLPGLAREWEIVVIDDGSRDRTSGIARGLAERFPGVRVVGHGKNRGWGGVQKTGFSEARQPFLSFVPADAQFPPEDLAKLAARAKDSDIVLGVRGRRPDPLHRVVQTGVFNFIVRRVLGLPYRDVNWVKIYRTEFVRGLPMKSRGIGLDTEILARARARGGRIAEVEAGYVPRSAGEATAARPLVVLRTLCDLLGVAWVLMRERRP